MEKRFGYIKDEIQPEDFVLGGLQLPTDILQTDGQWDKYIPDDEVQRTETYETYGCTIYGTLNALEFLFQRVFGVKNNWAERFVYIFTHTREPGNSPKTIIESIRKRCGLIDELLLPMSKAKTYEEYINPDPLPVLLLWKGEDFIDNYEIGYEWVLNGNRQFNKAESMKSALKLSPLGVAVCAWQYDFDKKVYVRPQGEDDNHWCVLYGYEDGKYWKCYDSYDKTIKFLDWNFGFERVLRYYTKKITHRSFWSIINNWLKDIFLK